MNIIHMKKEKMLTLALSLLTWVGSNAQGWEKPILETTAFVTGTELYLFNVDAEQFYTEGNSYGTQGSVKETGLKCKFVANGSAVKLTNYSVVKGSWRTAFITTNGALYVDGESVTDCYWEIVPVEGNIFKIRPSAPNPTYNQANYPDAMLGIDLFEDPTRTVLASILMESEEPGTGIYQTRWAVATPAAYNKYQTEMATYKAALTLEALLAEATEKGKDVSEEQAIYNDTTSTLGALNGAIDSVINKLIADYIVGASMDNPIDVTRLFITNPAYDNSDNEGWSGNEPSIDKLNELQNAEFFNTNFTYYQDLRNLPKGYYRVSVQGFYRAGLEGPALEAKQSGSEPLNAELYVTTNSQTTTAKIQSIFTEARTEALGVDGEINLGNWWVPNTMYATAGYFSAGYYNGNSLLVEVTNGKLRIGARKSTTIRRDWVMLDNWKLEYLGNGE